MTPAANSNLLRLLIVDDNESIHRDYRKVLSGDSSPVDVSLAELESALFDEPDKKTDAAYVLDFASQGEEAILKVTEALATDRPYTLVFLDVRMPPGIDGVETACRLLELDENLQIVLCTAYSDHSWEAMAERFGRTDRILILKKPFDRIEVLQLAQTLSEKWRLSRQSKAYIEGLDQLVRERTAELQDSNRLLVEENLV